MSTQFIHTCFRSLISNRRFSQRCRGRCTARLLPGAPEAPGSLDLEQVPPLAGQARDLSETGLSVKVSGTAPSCARLIAVGSHVRVVLEVSEVTQVILHAIVVHATKVAEEQGYLIGVRITKMSDYNRICYAKYLATLE